MGTRQMVFTIISITAALIAALIPILFLPDIVGRLFREFGLTLVAAVVTSAFVSLTLTPMMCAHIIGPARTRPLDALASRGNEPSIESLIATPEAWIARFAIAG